MHYRIFNVRTCMIILLRAYTHGVAGHTDIVLTKFSFSSPPDGPAGFKLGSWNAHFSPTLYQLSHPASPVLYRSIFILI